MLSGMKKIIAGEFDPTTLYFVIFFQILIHSGKLCHEMMKSYNGNDKVICLTFFVMSSLIFQAYEHQRIKEESCSQQEHVILSCEHLPNGSPCVMHVRSKCHIDQVLLESSLDFQHFLLVHQDRLLCSYYLVLLMLALVCACMTISIAGQKGHSKAKSGKVFSARQQPKKGTV